MSCVDEQSGSLPGSLQRSTNCCVVFEPDGKKAVVDSETRILVAARMASAPIRFMCSSLRCGTCAIQVDSSNGVLSAMGEDELKMLHRLKLAVDGTVRMACKTRILSGTVIVDLGFQDSYDPADNVDFSEDL